MAKMRAWFGKWLGRLVPSMAFVRYLLAFGVGIAATLAWQAYGSPARTAVAGWSPRLAWLAPPATPRSVSAADRIRATSQALAAVHQSVDKLASEVSRLETQASAAASAADTSAQALTQSKRAARR